MHFFSHRDPSLMIPGVADERNLAPAYDALQKAIRKADQRHSIFFEGVTWDFFAAGFKEVPGGPTYQNRSVLSYHYYEPPDFNKKFQFEVRTEDLKRLKCAGFVTELLVVGNSAKNFNDMLELFDICDHHMQSWTGWSFKAFGCGVMDSKCIADAVKSQHIYVQNTSRTYPQAVAGITKGFKFDVTTKKFYMSYAISPSCKSTETVIYFNKDLHYPNGVDVVVTPQDSVTWQLSGYKIIVEHSNKLSVGALVEVSITPK